MHYEDPDSSYMKMTKKELINIINTQANNYYAESTFKKEQTDKKIEALETSNKRLQAVGQILQSMSNMMECATRVALLLK